LIWKVGCIGVK